MQEFFTFTTAAIAALLAALSWRQRRDEAEREAEIEHRTAQLRKLYGPLQMQRMRSEANRTLLPEDDPGHPEGRWRLVHHIGDIRVAWELSQKGLPHDYTDAELNAVERIIENGDLAVDLIVSNAGLFQLPRADAYQKYVEHHEHLRMGWLSRTNQPYGDESYPFPGGPAGTSLEARCAGPEHRDGDLDCAMMLDQRTVEQSLAARRSEDPASALGERITSPKALIGMVFGVLLVMVIGALVSLSGLRDDTPPATFLVETDDGLVCARVVDGALKVGNAIVQRQRDVVPVQGC